MDHMRDQVANALQHGAMACEAGFAGERFRHEHQGKVPTARGGARVTGVLRAVVVDVDDGGIERRQALAQGLGDGGGQVRSSTR